MSAHDEEFTTPEGQPTASLNAVDHALTGIDRIRERIRAHGDLQARLGDLETQLNDMRRSSMATPSIDPGALKNAFSKLEARVKKSEELTAGLLDALTAINAKQHDLERLIHALGAIE